MRAHLRWGRFLVAPPGVPTITSVEGDASTPYVSFTWTPPTNTGGGLTGYVVRLNDYTPISVSAEVLSYQFTGFSFSSSECNLYTVRVKAVNDAGESDEDEESVIVPDAITPTIYNVIKTPNEMGPGVQYNVYWFAACAFGAVSEYEVETRLYFDGSSVVVSGDDDGWEPFYSGGNMSHLAWISTATSSTQWQFRVRGKNVVNGVTLSTTGWSEPATS